MPQKKLIPAIVLAFLVGLFGLPGLVSAYSIESVNVEPKGDFVLGPGKAVVSLAPGASTTKEVYIINRTGKTVSFDVAVEDFVASDKPQQVIKLLGKEKSPHSILENIKPEIDHFTLKPDQKIIFDVNISIPETAEPGGRYGAVLVSNAPSQAESQAQTTVVSRIGSLFLIRVEGPVEESAKLTDFGMSGPDRFFYDPGRFGFEILLENTGSVHLIPYGEVTITNMFGKAMGSVPVDAYFALPDSVRYNKVVWTHDGFMIGRYTAELTLHKGYGDEVAEATLHFWVIPWKVLLAVFLLFIILIILYRFFTRKFEIKRR